jgi:hypothetical protein
MNYLAYARSKVCRRALALCNGNAGAIYSAIDRLPARKDKLSDWAREFATFCQQGLSGDDDIVDLLLVIIGIATSSRNGITPESSHLAQINLYCKTNGRLQELTSLISQFADNAFERELYSSTLSPLKLDQLSILLAQLIEYGYAAWPSLLPSSSLAKILTKFHSSRQWSIVNERGISQSFSGFIRCCDTGLVKAASHVSLDEQWLIDIAFDFQLKLIVDTYLRGSAHLVSAQLWLSRPGGNAVASDQAAQLFHYDLDSHKWLKVFVYLNHVTEETGPHCAVLGTHAPDAKNRSLLAMKYARISDDQIKSLQPQEIRTFTGPAGTVLIGDTKAYHKGMKVQRGERMVLQLLYSCSSFALSFGQ